MLASWETINEPFSTGVAVSRAAFNITGLR